MPISIDHHVYLFHQATTILLISAKLFTIYIEIEMMLSLVQIINLLPFVQTLTIFCDNQKQTILQGLIITMYKVLLLLVVHILGCMCQNQQANLTQAAIENAQSQLVTPAYTISSIFIKYPTSQELNQIILSADSFVIIKLIQNLLDDDSLPCKDAITYLMEIDGRIKSAIEQKTFASDRLAVIIRVAEDQIRRLNLQILRFQGMIKSLMLETKKSELEKMVASLLQNYQTLNSYNETLKARQAEIKTAEAQIIPINTELSVARNVVVAEKLAINEIQAEIKNLEDQLKNAKDRREASLSFVRTKEKEIQENQKKVADLRQKIGFFEFQINSLKDKITQTRLKINTLEVDSERLRSDIADGERRQTQFLANISSLNEKRREQGRKLDYSTLESLRSMKDALKNLQPGIAERINEQYYSCFANGLVTVQKIGSFTFFSINGMDLSGYIKNVYGIDMPAPLSLRDSKVLLEPMDIFSDKWVERYGQAISNTTFEQTQDFSQLTNFWCINPSLQSGGYGKVLQITADQITIRRKDGGDLRVSLSACSRMESQIASMPESGQQIFWKGSSLPNPNGIYEAQMATFIR